MTPHVPVVRRPRGKGRRSKLAKQHKTRPRPPYTDPVSYTPPTTEPATEET